MEGFLPPFWSTGGGDVGEEQGGVNQGHGIGYMDDPLLDGRHRVIEE